MIGEDLAADLAIGTPFAGADEAESAPHPAAAEARAGARTDRGRPTICLNMIVRDEAPVIRRCLDSVMPIVDCWAIVDTGSTDGTQDIVRAHMAGKPGMLHERPWVDFAHNRSEALALARGMADYVFTIDADEVLDMAADFEMPALDADSYQVEMEYSGCRYTRRALLRDALPWRYEGVLHEYSVCDEARSEGFLPGLVTRPRSDGARARDPETYRRDAEILERALAEEPDNARTVFYLAQSYRDAGELELAVRHYRRRLELGGWAEELFYSRYQIAAARERMGHAWPEAMEEYLAAWAMMPDRAEPLYRIGMHYQALGDHAVSQLFLGRAAEMKAPGPDRLFVEQAVYGHLAAIEYAVACFYVGDHEAAIRTNNRLLGEGRAPPEMIDLIVRNRRFSVDAVAPLRRGNPAGGPLHVLVEVGESDPAIDDIVESLSRQNGSRFRAIFTGPNAEAKRARLALEDGRFAVAAGGAADYLAALAGPDDPVLMLEPGATLADPGLLARIRAMFDDPGCRLAYGQNRRANGSLGDAQPAADEADWEARGAAIADGGPIAFRASLFGAGGEGGRREAIFRAAGFEGIRFSDEVWTLAAPERPEPAGAGELPAPFVGRGAPPLISCLMVTYDRLALAKRAIRSFAAQSWANRELVIVTAGAPRFRDAIAACLADLGLDEARLIHLDEDDPPLGRLRNLSLESARGELLCQWDDDDFSHPDRLAIQAAHLENEKADACLLTDHLHHIADRNILCWVDWTDGGTASGIESMAPQTLMMRSGLGVLYPEDGPNARMGEDSVMLEALDSGGAVSALSGAGHLYLYHYHGANIFPREHHDRIASFRRPAEHLRTHAAPIREMASRSGLARPCAALGREGVAFTL